MRAVTFQKGRYGKTLVELRDGDALLRRVSSSFADERDFKAAASDLSVDPDRLRGAIDAWSRGGEPGFDVPDPGVDIVVRGRVESDGQTYSAPEPLATLRLAVEAPPPPEALIEWADRSVLCALDVDFEEVPDDIGSFDDRVSPRPGAYWRTHGGGLRLVYPALDVYAADELAAIGALAAAERWPAASIELKRGTRHPGSAFHGKTAGPVRWMTPDTDLGAAAGWVGKRGVVDDAMVAAWLEERGMQVGGRYPHALCPVDQSPAGRDPVCVREAGVFCHACAGRGVAHGHRLPGWFTWGAVLGTGREGTLALCARRFTHWEHAGVVFKEEVGDHGEVGRLAWAAALKSVHGADPRVPAVFAAGRNFIRLDGMWATLDGEAYVNDVRPILAKLPACQYVGPGGKLQVDMELVARLDQPICQADQGYPAIRPVWGVRIYSHRLPFADSSVIPLVMWRGPPGSRPRYVKHRDEEAAWRSLNSLFPGLNRALVKLLVVARGVAEGEVGMPPMIFISGPTASAKSSTVVLAAAILGDSNHSVVWSSNGERVRQALLEAKQGGTFVTFNEILKEGARSGASTLQTMDYLLNLTPDSLSHKLYIGPVRLGGLPVCVWTDTEVPSALKQDAQLARRLVHVHLPKMVDWTSTLKSSGVHQIRNLRSQHPDMCGACDSVLSAVVDEFFSFPRTFEDMAHDLGFKTLAESAEAEEGRAELLALYRAVCAAPEPFGADARRWKGAGWRVVTRDASGDLPEAWRAVCDEGFVSARRAGAADWAKLLGVADPVELQIRPHGGSRVAVRFMQSGRTNREIS